MGNWLPFYIWGIVAEQQWSRSYKSMSPRMKPNICSDLIGLTFHWVVWTILNVATRLLCTALKSINLLLINFKKSLYYSKMHVNFFIATILSCGWIIYLTYYNSRNIGLILTLVLNRLHKNGYIHIGKSSQPYRKMHNIPLRME